ncbi:MAG: GNAT family N-acetyltransferase [Clostridia bacterium]|nr:GNAT family N-acetyltransferase [Deltaproteobacteria bacterium]
MPEMGAGGLGFAIHDSEVDAMFAAYNAPRAAYFVGELDGVVVAGAGFAQLAKGDTDTCELRKMYALPASRGKGLGALLLAQCLSAAKRHSYARCYIETLTSMRAARKLYERNGFHRLEGPLGNTGHYGCDCWYVRPL